MRWLRQDDGIVLVLVGLLLVVLLAIAGLAVDMGTLYAERGELRNGADAAALAIAEDCAQHAMPCDLGTATGTAQVYADANSGDGASGVSVNLSLTASTSGTVQVVTSAYDNKVGASGVRVPLMGLLGLDRVSVTATATAIFDHPLSARALPLLIERDCMYELHGSSGYVFLRAAGDGSGTGSCQQSPPVGGDAPGAFGWAASDSSSCRASFFRYQQVSFVDAGADGGQPPPGCSGARSEIYGNTVMVPIYYEDLAGDPRVGGFGAFHVQGYRFGTDAANVNPSICPPTTSCLRGYFTSLTLYEGNSGGPDYGVALVKLTR